MFDQAYRYRFADGNHLQEAQKTLRLATLAAEGIFGEAQVQMDAACVIDESINVIVIDASTPVGKVVNRVFAIFILREFGLRAFQVVRVEGLA